jgi:hypothetical protein
LYYPAVSCWLCILLRIPTILKSNCDLVSVCPSVYKRTFAQKLLNKFLWNLNWSGLQWSERESVVWVCTCRACRLHNMTWNSADIQSSSSAGAHLVDWRWRKLPIPPTATSVHHTQLLFRKDVYLIKIKQKNVKLCNVIVYQ